MALVVKNLGTVEYGAALQCMRDFTDSRVSDTPDEIWLLEHFPVFTQGQAGKAEHLLAPGDIPVVASDRGGQVTYHGPGQLIIYPLLDLRRRKLGVRDLVSLLETTTVKLLAEFAIVAAARADAPGVYGADKKIASLGLRVRRGCSFHGLSLNVAMDLSPFLRINPCGYRDLAMAQMADYGPASNMALVQQRWVALLAEGLLEDLIEPA